jgi:hypothetical protein
MKPHFHVPLVSALVLGLALPLSVRADLKSRFESELRVATHLQEIKESLKNRHVVFVAGFLNEGLGDRYFRDLVRYLTGELGLPSNQVTVLPNPSKNSVELNAANLVQDLAKAYEAGGKKPLLVIPHSKGSPEAGLAGAWLAKENVKHFTSKENPGAMIDKIISVQGAFQGSPLADKFQGVCPEALAGHLVCDGLLSMKQASMRDLFQKELTELLKNRDAAHVFSEHLFYVRSYRETKSSVAPILKATTLSLEQDHSSNDGILLALDQSIAPVTQPKGKSISFGTDLTGGVDRELDADHTSFFCTNDAGDIKSVSVDTPEYREAFFRALIIEAYIEASPRPAPRKKELFEDIWIN